MKVQLFGFAMLGLTALAACSSEQSLMEPVKLSDLTYTGCKTSYSAKESRPEFYAREKEKTPKMTISVGSKGIATVRVTDLEYDCITEKINAQIDTQDDEMKIVIAPYKQDPTLEVDCYCKYDAGFKLSNLASGKYHMKVYLADYYGKYDATSPAYEGAITFKPNTTQELELLQ